MIVIYGDHYGLSSSDYNAISSVLGKTSDWTSYDTAQFQTVPFMIHMDGLKGGIKKEYAGEIDVLPTILHLLGVNTKDYIQFGTDMLSKEHKQIVVFRNGTIVTPKYTIINGKATSGNVYDTKTGKLIKTFTNTQKKELRKLVKYESESLHYSDTLNNRDLLRFYTPKGFIPVTPTQFNYITEFQQMIKLREQLGKASTSLYSQHKGTTTNLYQTDAPELKGRTTEITTVPESISGSASSSSSSSTSSSNQSSSSSK